MNDEPKLGFCCGCGKEAGVRNIVCLDKTHKDCEGFGWGCMVCGLPNNGAVAVLCDKCLNQEPPKILFFVKGYPAENIRGLYAELTDTFEHDMSKHEA